MNERDMYTVHKYSEEREETWVVKRSDTIVTYQYQQVQPYLVLIVRLTYVFQTLNPCI